MTYWNNQYEVNEDNNLNIAVKYPQWNILQLFLVSIISEDDVV